MAKSKEALSAANPASLSELANTAPKKQNTSLSFETANGSRFRVVDFYEEMTARQDEDLLALVGEIFPAIASLEDDNVLALRMLINAVTGDSALARQILAILFLPEASSERSESSMNSRVYRKADVAARVEIIGDLTNRQLFPLFEAITDFFVFVGQKFPNVSATFLTLGKAKTIAG